MIDTLIINAHPDPHSTASATNRMVAHLLTKLPAGSVQTINLAEADIQPLNKAALEMFTGLYGKWGVKRGLRDKNGIGVLAGLTHISDVQSYEGRNGRHMPCKGRLIYRGYDVNKLVDDFVKNERFGFEETAYLLLFGELPDKDQLAELDRVLAGFRRLPKNFVRCDNESAQ